MKYKKLKGICKVAIETGVCLGCSRLELESFEGVTECNTCLNGKTQCKAIIEQLRIGGN